MIEANIRIENDPTDWFRGPCMLPAIPPLGGHIRVMDRNANIQRLRVADIIVDAASITLDAETPGGLGIADKTLRIDIVCAEI